MSRRNYDPAAYPSREERLKAVTDQLEAGVSEVFQSGKYENYLTTMSKFHRYSFNNVLLIAMQRPGATHVAGYNDWKKNFGRHVRKGEKSIKILAPCAFSAMLEMEMMDPKTQQPILDKHGNPRVERVPIDAKRFRVVSVYDISQTEGDELPTIAAELNGSVERYEEIAAALKKVSPFPIQFADLPGEAKGCCIYAKSRIIVRPGMSEAQTLKTMVHEIAHAKLHSQIQGDGFLGDTPLEMRRTREVEAESVAYVVCQHLGVDTSDYSFGYIADWSHGKELKELKSSLSRIRNSAAELIDGIERPGLEHTEAAPRRTPPHRHPTRQKRQQSVR